MNNFFIIKNIRVFFCDLINFSHMRAAAITSNAVAFIYSFFLHVFQVL